MRAETFHAPEAVGAGPVRRRPTLAGGRWILRAAVGRACLAVAILLVTGGCGNFTARRLAQAPNTYPQFLAPTPRVLVEFSDAIFTNNPAHWSYVGPQPARLCYRIVEPEDYQVRMTWTNWWQDGRPHAHFTFAATLPRWHPGKRPPPRGTIVLLHGYGLDQSLMVPWALRLAQEGWRCVLVDLRGHGRSTGRRIYYGIVEAGDLSQLLDDLQRRGCLREPVGALGESYGAALALRWGASEARLRRVVAVAPYAELAPAAMRLRDDYAPWFPKAWLRSGLAHLPGVLGVKPGELDPVHFLVGNHVNALYVAGMLDRIAPPDDVRRLLAECGAECGWLLVPDASHETVPYRFDTLVPAVLDWFGQMAADGHQPVGRQGPTPGVAEASLATCPAKTRSAPPR